MHEPEADSPYQDMVFHKDDAKNAKQHFNKSERTDAALRIISGVKK